MNRDQLGILLERYLKGIPVLSQSEQLLDYYDLVLQENELQNLTTMVTPEEFFFRHIYDSAEILKANWIQYPALDIGSGAGAPGLVVGILDPFEDSEWHLTESEKKKPNSFKK